MLLKKSGGLLQFGAIGYSKAQVIQPDTIWTEAVIGDSLAFVPGRGDAHQDIAIRQHKARWQFRRHRKVEKRRVEVTRTHRVGNDEPEVMDARNSNLL